MVKGPEVMSLGEERKKGGGCDVSRMQLKGNGRDPLCKWVMRMEQDGD